MTEPKFFRIELAGHLEGWYATSADGTTFQPDRQYAVKTIVVGLNERPPTNGRTPILQNMQARAGTTDAQSPRATNSQSFNSNHAGGINFLFGDGHIDTVDAEADVLILKQLASINGRETASADDF